MVRRCACPSGTASLGTGSAVSRRLPNAGESGDALTVKQLLRQIAASEEINASPSFSVIHRSEFS